MSNEITMVRIYVTEGDKILNSVMDYLHNTVKVQGVTVFRAISGFGKSGAMHSSSLLSMSLDLPLVIEFFDVPEKVKETIPRLVSLAGKGHVVSWSANAG
jgi:PII-like signaling protein